MMACIPQNLDIPIYEGFTEFKLGQLGYETQ
jgi:hypothetical protein